MTEDEKRAARIAEERFRWWQLAETYWRCIGIARDAWDTALDAAEAEQEQLAVEMRDRHSVGIRADGVTKYPIDTGIPVPLLTPRDKVQFVKEAAVTLFIEACKKSLPVTPGGKRAAQKTDGPDTVEAGSGVDETNLDDEARELAQAGEAAALGGQAFAISETPPS